MATILTKKSDTASAVPLAADLTNAAGGAELAVNATDKRLFSKTSGGTVVELGINPSSLTMPNGTANGVAYLNGSKVVTSGSALTFDGTNFATTGSGTFSGLLNRIHAQGTDAYITNTTTGKANTVMGFNDSGSTNGQGIPTGYSYYGSLQTYPIGFTSSGYLTNSISSTNHIWNITGSEQMRLTSTGLGIGTSSPSNPLHIVSNTVSQLNIAASSGNTNAQINLEPTGTGIALIGPANNVAFAFRTNATERMRIDASGNLGLGVTPSAWGSPFSSVMQFTKGSIACQSNSVILFNNAYYDGSNYRYVNTAGAGYYEQTGGQHIWNRAASGTAGNAITFTQAMTLDASGRLIVGATSASGSNQVEIQTGLTNGLWVQTGSTSSSNYVAEFRTGSNASVLALRADNTALVSGNLLVGEPTAFINGSTRLQVYHPTAPAAELSTGSGATTDVLGTWNRATSGDNQFISFYTETSSTRRGSITYNRGAGLVAYNITSDYRAKDITGAVSNSGALIDSVPVYMGKMKGATQERPMFIAHETPAYAHTGEKDAVDADGNPVYQQMDASALIPVMWAEIQSLRARVAQLESK